MRIWGGLDSFASFIDAIQHFRYNPIDVALALLVHASHNSQVYGRVGVRGVGLKEVSKASYLANILPCPLSLAS